MNSASHHRFSVHELRSSLEQRLGRLRFGPALEAEFLAHLHRSQHRSATATIAMLVLVWAGYTGLDVWRLQALGDSPEAHAFFWRAFMLRWPVLLCFALALWNLVTARSHSRGQELRVALGVLCCSVAIVSSSYTLKNLGMLEASVAMVLIVSLAFFPLGVRWRTIAPVALLACLIITLSGPVLLHHREDLPGHWMLSAVVWINLALSGTAAYYRERGLREQFLLRRLLDWEASHDPLTGLANRRLFQEHFERCMQQARREGDALHLVILDIDHFKLYNDHYGHGAGDEVLRQVARLLQQHAQRPMDLAVRLGGEEFALVIYGVGTEQLSMHLQKLQRALAGLGLEHQASPTAAYVTISIGATPVQGQDTQDTALLRADALLYQAKHQGRNQVCLRPARVPDGQALATA